MEKLARWLSPARVEGDSMSPTLPRGSLVAVSPLRGDPPVGAVVIVRRPDGTEHLKRVAEKRTDGTFVVLGDNPAASTDSRQYGPIERRDIVAIARACYWPPSSWKLLRLSPRLRRGG
jgi:nickel-type superoxide dismutase maturation protease